MRQFIYKLPIVCLGLVSFAVADDALNEPFYSSNLNPLVQVYGLPTTRSALLAEKKQWKTSLQLEAANSFTFGDNSQEAIFIDGETYRVTASANYGIGDRLELGDSGPELIFGCPEGIE